MGPTGLTLIYPPPSASNVPVTVTFTWTAIGATSFDIYLGTSKHPPLLQAGLTAPSYTHGLLASKKYYWKVVARNGAGSTSSAVRTFTTGVTTPPPQPPGPDPLVLTVPPAQSVVASGPTVVTYPAPTTTGGVAPVQITTAPSSGSVFPVGTTGVAVQAQSSDGQVATGSFPVTVSLLLPPPPPPTLVLTVPSSVAITSASPTVVNYPAPVTSGGVPPVAIVAQPASGSVFPVGVTTVNVQAHSSDGQIATGSFTVTVTAPPPQPQPLAIVCPIVAPQVSLNGSPVAVTFVATASGGTAPIRIIYSIGPGSLFPVGTTFVTATAQDAIGSTASCTFSVVVVTGSSNVLTPADLGYLGTCTMPNDPSLSWAFTNGAISGRRMGNGDIHIFLCQTSPLVFGQNDFVAEVKYNGVGQVASLVTNWGDVAKGKRVSGLGTAGVSLEILGLFWDDVAQQLWWAYGPAYAGNYYWDPSVGTSTLSGSDNSGVTAYGPWRMGVHSQKSRGYMFNLPANLQAALGGKRLAVGAPITSGNSLSPWGAYAAAFTPPANGLPPSVVTDSVVAIPTTDVIFSDINNRQTRPGDCDQCGWLHYGETDSFGDQPQSNPVQNGTGCTPHGLLCGALLSSGQTSMFSIDVFRGAAFVNGPNKQGLIYIAQICRTLAGYTYAGNGRNHVTYGPTQDPGAQKHLCVHGQNGYQYSQSTGDSTQTQLSSLYIYDPADLLAVAQGTKSPVGLTPSTNGYDLSQIAHPNGPSFPQLCSSLFAYGGAWFEPVSKQLFVSEGATVHVFSVNC